MHMARNYSVKEPLYRSLNAHLNDTSKKKLDSSFLNDHLNDFLNEKLNLDWDDPFIDKVKDYLDDPGTQQLNKPNKNLDVHLNDPNQKPLNDPLNNYFPLALYLELEDDEFSDDMALHDPPDLEPPDLQPPPNSPTMQSMQESPTSSTNLAPHAKMEEDDSLDSDEFEDSIGIQSMNLHGSLADCEKAIILFFSNRLDNAVSLMTPGKENSLYHAHAASVFEFIPAILTMEPGQIQRAQESLRQTFTLCAQMRRSYTFVQSIGAIIKKPNYGGYTEEEAHAELVHAEGLLVLACLGVIENEDMTGFLRASLRIKASYNSYRICAKILAKKTWENETSRAHFESGVRLGLATFNVMIAMMPPRVITLLEFVGFSADKEKGIAELLKASQSPGLRSVLCDLTLLVYYLVIGHFAAIPPDFIAAEKILSKSLKKYPNSIWFLMFKARMQLLRGKVLDAIETYQKTCRTKDLWPQLKHLAYWELVWAFAMLRQWTNAAEYAAFLEHDSKWSRTIYMYAQAAMLIENGPQSPGERKCIDDLLTNAPSHRQRLLGRSLPMEKFAVRRCERWASRGYLVLPGIEWLYLWNIFPSLAADRNLSDDILKIIERAYAKIKISLEKKKNKAADKDKPADTTDATDYDQDDLALVELLQGSLLCAMGLPRLALKNLEAVIAMKEDIKENTFLLPYATLEIATCFYQLGDSKRAQELIQDARKKYSGYLLEARLHFRIHSKLESIKAGISVAEKPAGMLSVTGVTRKTKPKLLTSMIDEGLYTKKSEPITPSCSTYTPRAPNIKTEPITPSSSSYTPRAPNIKTEPITPSSSTYTPRAPNIKTEPITPSSSTYTPRAPNIKTEPITPSSSTYTPRAPNIKTEPITPSSSTYTPRAPNIKTEPITPSSSSYTPRAPNLKINSGSDLFSSVNYMESSESSTDSPGSSSPTNTGLDLLSGINSVPETVTTLCPSVIDEPMPSTSSNFRPSSFRKLKIVADIEPSEPGTSAAKPANFNPASKLMSKTRSVKKDAPSVSFEMDLITSADSEPNAAESGVEATESVTRMKGRT